MAAEKKATRAAYGETLVELVEQGIDVVASRPTFLVPPPPKAGRCASRALVNVASPNKIWLAWPLVSRSRATPHSLARSPCSALAVCMIKFATPCAMRI